MTRILSNAGSIGALLVLLPGLLAIGCSDSDDDDPVTGVTSVDVDDDFFSPSAIEVPVGTEVTWSWVGERPHDVVGDDFRTEIQTEGTFAHRFERSGTYEYRCTVHRGMTGLVVVQDGGQ